MKNVLNWVTEEKRINKIDTIIENDKLIGTFTIRWWRCLMEHW